jgi:hypothetical protein
MSNQALLALRELLMPKSELSGEVTRYAEGLVHVATREGQRVVIRNNMVTGIIGAAQDVPTFYV